MKLKNPWKKITSKEIYENPWIKLTEHQVITPGNTEGIYGEVHFKNYAIGIIPLTDQLETYLVGQYRFPLEAYSWEIPMGGGPLDESLLASARRELLEETGIEAKNWQNIMTIHTSNSVCDEEGYIFIASDLSFGNAEPEITEDLEVKKLPFDEAYHLVMNGEITDSISIAGISKTKFLLDKGLLKL